MFPDELLINPSSIAQDIKGNIWIASRGQLTKYDGYSTTYYRSGSIGSSSFAGNILVRVYPDKNGIIWIGTIDAGLQRLDPSTNTFTQYKHDVKDSNSISNDFVTSMLEDKDGNFWVGTNDGLNKLDRITGKFTHYLHNANDPTSLSNDHVRAIYQDSRGILWIGTGDPFPHGNTLPGEGGLNKMDGKTGKFTSFIHDDKDSTTLIDNMVNAIFEDKAGNFWIGTAGDGLHLMNRQTGKFTRLTYDPKHPDKLSRSSVNKNIEGTLDHITFIKQDETGALWIGEYGRGLTRYDEQTKQVQHFNGKDSLSGFNNVDEYLFGHCISKDGLLWICGFAGNVYTINTHTLKVPYIKDGGSHFSFYRSNDSTLFLGEGIGLFSKNLKTGAIHQYPVKAPVQCLQRDDDENLWIGTYGNGLYKLNVNSGRILHFNHSKDDANSLSNDTVLCIATDKDKNTWIGTEYGLNKLAKGTNKCVHYVHDGKDSASIVGNEIYALEEDDDRSLWVGTQAALCKLNIITGKCRRYFSNDVTAIRKSSDGTIWFGGWTGLFKLDKGSGNIIPVVDSVNNQSIIIVVGGAEDAQKNVWFSTGIGLVKYDHRNQQIITFNKNAGVDKDSINWFATYADESGNIYIGGPTGYYMFKPADLQPKGKAPGVVFTNFQIGNQQIKAGDHAVLKQDILYTNSIHLKYNQNIFSFEFHPVDYNNPSENHCFYKLENYDNEWRPATNPAKAYYVNVPPGNYVFHVKAVNSLGIWAEKSITITVATPWWATWWFRILSVIAMIVVVYFIVQKQSRILKKQNIMLEEKVIERTKELTHSLEELRQTQAQLIQAEKMASLGELTAGIAHEIQNPLNFVNNFSEVNKEMIEELLSERSKVRSERDEELENEILNDIKDNEEKINHHGKRADAIVKGMLQHSKASTGKKESTDVNALCDEYLRLAYHGMRAKDKDFNTEIKTDFDESIGKINMVSQDMGRVLLNLYNNAFYAVNEKNKQKQKDLTGSSNLSGQPAYVPTVTIVTKKSGDKVKIKVVDNGNGIPRNIIDKIFQPFFTTKPTGQGTGLGLSLSYDIIKAHNGEIRMDTKQGEGSEFVIQLPV